MKKDQNIASLIRDGDISSFELLYEMYSSSLLWFSYSFIRDKTICEDVVQDSFMAIWQQRSTFSSDMNIKNYVMTIVRNKSISKLREIIKMRQQSINELTAEDYYLQRKLMSLEDISCSTIDLDTIKNQIIDSLKTMPEGDRMVFIMSRYEYLNNEEIADRMNIAIKTVEKRMTKVLKKLRSTLKDNYIFVF